MQRHPNRDPILGEERSQSHLLPPRVSLQLLRDQSEEEAVEVGLEREQEESEDVQTSRLCGSVEPDGERWNHGKDTCLGLR